MKTEKFKKYKKRKNDRERAKIKLNLEDSTLQL